MTRSKDWEHKPHRLFHAMVLMGGSLALGCGGNTESQQGSGNGAGGTGSGGDGGSGGVGGVGGSTSSNNVATIGGTAIVPSGGSGPIEPGPFECTPAQWECEQELEYCAGSGFSLPEGCACNEERPASPADCQAGDDFVCLYATENAAGIRFTEEVPFSCQCMPEQDNCSGNCDEVAFPGSNCNPLLTDGAVDTVLCGCAVIVLR